MTLSAAELAEWVEFYSLEPWGSEPAFMRSGIITAMIANVNRDTTKKTEPFTPQDFMPKFGRKKADPLDPTILKSKMINAFGGRIKRGGRKADVHDQRGEAVGAEPTQARPGSGAEGRGQGPDGGSKDDREGGEGSSPG